MGITAEIKKIFDFIYKAEFDNGLTGYEYDHVFIGKYTGKISPDPAEVSDYCYRKMDEIHEDIMSHPQLFTDWFKISFPKVQKYLTALWDY